MKNPRSILVDVAAEWVGTVETSTNRFKGDQKLWSATNYPDGWRDRQPYCAAFLCYVVMRADQLSEELSFPTRPRHAATIDWISWARKASNGVQVFTPRSTTILPEPGDIVQFRPHFSHIGLVTGRDLSKGIITTIEANTDDQGGREGNGIWRKSRKLSICGEFYRLPVKALKVS